MSKIDQCLERLALLDRADRLLSEVRLYHHQVPLREQFAQHRMLLGEARRHLDSARSIGGH
ncbi:hypothetical protein [Azospirillum thermophilum]|uniref:Uncharacterized protein n=1 Tax=Azospirillum thermophilum TaxID=2202148 RepID=A0A2S2CPJ4_9PROT|nr:hypothetical protein [Azospirillum thermophilum]AWK86421.1 hypothetical protein DEW08_09360 [Azospirillum thermophilum]